MAFCIMEKGKHGAEIWRYLGFTPPIKAAALRKPDLVDMSKPF